MAKIVKITSNVQFRILPKMECTYESMSVCGLINQSANMVMSHALPKKESKTMIIWKSGFTLSGIHSPVPWGYFFVKFRQIMAAQSALVTFSKDSALSGERIIFLDKYNT